MAASWRRPAMDCFAKCIESFGGGPNEFPANMSWSPLSISEIRSRQESNDSTELPIRGAPKGGPVERKMSGVATSGIESFVIVRPKASDASPAPARPAAAKPANVIEATPEEPPPVVPIAVPEPAPVPARLVPEPLVEEPPTERSKKKGFFGRSKSKKGEVAV